MHQHHRPMASMSSRDPAAACERSRLGMPHPCPRATSPYSDVSYMRPAGGMYCTVEPSTDQFVSQPRTVSHMLTTPTQPHQISASSFLREEGGGAKLPGPHATRAHGTLPRASAVAARTPHLLPAMAPKLVRPSSRQHMRGLYVNGMLSLRLEVKGPGLERRCDDHVSRASRRGNDSPGPSDAKAWRQTCVPRGSGRSRYVSSRAHVATGILPGRQSAGVGLLCLHACRQAACMSGQALAIRDVGRDA
nr:hypothetical protein CFP56_32496 [Quercus suber]